MTVEKPKPIQDYMLDSLFREDLDELLPEVEIGALTYAPSRALYNIDPIAYRVEFSNWLDAELEEDRLVEVDNEYYRKEHWDDYLQELEWEKEWEEE